MPRHPRPAETPDENGATEVVPFQGLLRYERQIPIHQISYYLCGEIREPEYYTELFYTLRTAAETDLVYLHLNSPGGDFDTGLQIINNMRASAARVVTVLEARAYSMAAFIFLAGDELVVHDNCQLMFHTYTSGFFGKGHEQQAEVAALGNWFQKVMTRICTPFMTTAEIDRVLKGGDLWMDSDEIQRRLKRVFRTAATPRRAVRAPKRTVAEAGLPPSPNE